MVERIARPQHDQSPARGERCSTLATRRSRQIIQYADSGFFRFGLTKTKLTLVDKVFYRRQLTPQLSADPVPTHSVLAHDTLTQLLPD